MPGTRLSDLPGLAAHLLERAIVSAALAATLLTGCPIDEPRPSCDGSSGLVEAGGWIALWEGHAYSWEQLSHRIGWLRVGVDTPYADGGFDAELGLIGGTWSTGAEYTDIPSYELAHRRVRAPELSAWYGEVAMQVDASGRAAANVQLTPSELGLPPGRYAVALRGICVDTDVPLADGAPDGYDPADGWTPSGLGAGVTSARVAGAQVEFDAWMHFEAGTLDRQDMNAAAPYARIDATVQYVVLAFAEGAVTTAQVAGASFTESQGGSHTEIAPVPTDELSTTARGESSFGFGMPLLRSWDLDLNRSEEEDRGRYLRAWEARIDSFEYDPATGEAEIGMSAAASHSSAFQEGDMEVDFRGEIDLLQLPAGETLTPQARIGETRPTTAQDLRGVAAGQQSVIGAWVHTVDSAS